MFVYSRLKVKGSAFVSQRLHPGLNNKYIQYKRVWPVLPKTYCSSNSYSHSS